MYYEEYLTSRKMRKLVDREKEGDLGWDLVMNSEQGKFGCDGKKDKMG